MCSIELPKKFEGVDLTIELYPFLFYYIKCHNASKNFHKEDNLTFTCPNACNVLRCNTGSYMIENSCKIKGLGIYKSSYDCNCSENAYWSTHSKLCYAIDPCKGNICNDNECEFDHSSLEYKCRCGETTMGANCDKPRNACEENYYGETKSGNEQCKNIYGMGTCIPFLGLNFYKCQCIPGWTDDKSHINFPNCKIKIDPCASKICHYGYCSSNESGHAYCKCDEDWEGEKCNVESEIWFPWGEWSDCRPKCGQQIRRRDCSKKDRNCSRTNFGNEQIRECNLVECVSPIGTPNFKPNSQSKMFKLFDIHIILFSSFFAKYLLN